MSPSDFEEKREQMVRRQLAERGIEDERVLEAFRRVPREQFVNEEHRSQAYADRALPTSSGQTISQPYMVAMMTESLDVEAGDRILEIGTGSGYQTAILAEMGARVCSVEQDAELSMKADRQLTELDYDNCVNLTVGDGTKGWSEHAPYDGVIVTAAAPDVPGTLRDQTAVGGRIVIPVGSKHQQHIKVLQHRSDGTWDEEETIPCVFVPLVGDEGWDSGKR